MKSLFKRDKKKRRKTQKVSANAAWFGLNFMYGNDKDEIKENIYNKEAYQHNLYAHIKMTLAGNLCCCLKNSKWYKKYKKLSDQYSQAQEMLAEEVDIKNLINSSRVGKFVNKVTINEC